MERFLKSVFWLLVTSGIGYGLLVTVTPSEDKFKKFEKEFSGAKRSPGEIKSKNQNIFDTLQSASNSDKPLYLMSKKEIENLRSQRD